MHVYFANCGPNNWAWQDCLTRSTIVLQEDVSLFPFWERRDRVGYVREVELHWRMPNGRPWPPGVASRWFNLHNEFRESANDLWIHQDGDELWWTLSSDAPPSDEIIDDPRPRPQFTERRIHVFHKPCSAWSNLNRNNVPLRRKRIYPRARKFLVNKPGTFRALSPDNAAYAQALINGNPLSGWHNRPDWQADARREPGWRGPI